jgi:transmembrane sensor
MMPQNIPEKTIKKMIRRYISGRATEAEKTFLDAYYDYLDTDRPDVEDELGKTMKDHVMAHAAGQHSSVVRLRALIYYAAACLLIMISFGIFFMTKKNPTEQGAIMMKNDVAPSGNKAILTLSNGQQIILGQQQGYIANQGHTRIVLNAVGNVNYVKGTSDETEALYNKLTVPVGNKRDIVLADGTEVSLDAGSTLTFPIAFNGRERSVTLTGQGFFKVKHNEAQPFLVKVKQYTIRDIGTEFNINAYDDESQVKTTLFDGIVKMDQVTLKPGQQATANGADIKLQDADLEMAGAWRHNDFIFRGQDLRSTMRQIARWYNVHIIYLNAPEQLHIRAAISRGRNLSVILQLIEKTGKVKFKVEGRTITVSQ